MLWLALKRLCRHPAAFQAPTLRARTRKMLNYLKQAARYQKALNVETNIDFDGSQRLTVVLLSYKRIENMRFIAAACLKLPYVDRVVVSNNNPDDSIREWLPIDDPRITLIDQPERTLPGVRYEIAREVGGDYFFCIDDDLFLTPDQLHALFLELIRQPPAPLGVQGQDVIDEPFGFTVSLRKPARQVDVLNRFYAFTAAHLDEYFRLLELFGSPAANELGFVEDIVLSFAGSVRPSVHDVGRFLNCPTGDVEGVGIWVSNDDFVEKRRHVYEALRREKPLVQEAAAACLR